MNEKKNLRVALVWSGTILQERTFTRTSDPVVTVGEDARNMFIVPAPGLPDDFAMFERGQDGAWAVRYTDRVSGTLTLGEQECALEEMGERAQRLDSSATQQGAAEVMSVPLAAGDWGLVQIGPANQIFFQLIGDPPLAPRRGLFAAVTGLTAVLAGFIALSGLAHGVFLLVAFASYDPQARLDAMYAEDRFANFVAEELSDPLEEEEVEIPEEDTTGKKAGGEEGKVGIEETEIEETELPKVDGEMVDEVDIKNIGLNKALSSDLLGAGPLKNVFGSSDGLDAKMNVAMDGLGGDLAIGRGAGGMDMRGTGGGGGGDGFGRLHAIGRVDTGGGKGAGGKIGKGKKKKVAVNMQRKTPKIGDFCDKSNIRRVVGGKSSAIRYCFERELQTQPDLGGKVVISWRIGMDGKVMSASIASSSLGSKSAEGCMTRVVKMMRFEKPNGGICVIQYPFIFSSGE